MAIRLRLLLLRVLRRLSYYVAVASIRLDKPVSERFDATIRHQKIVWHPDIGGNEADKLRANGYTVVSGKEFDAIRGRMRRDPATYQPGGWSLDASVT